MYEVLRRKSTQKKLWDMGARILSTEPVRILDEYNTGFKLGWHREIMTANDNSVRKLGATAFVGIQRPDGAVRKKDMNVLNLYAGDEGSLAQIWLRRDGLAPGSDIFDAHILEEFKTYRELMRAPDEIKLLQRDDEEDFRMLADHLADRANVVYGQN